MSTLLIKLIDGEISGKKARKELSKIIEDYFYSLPAQKKSDLGTKARCTHLMKKRLLQTIAEIEQLKKDSA